MPTSSRLYLAQYCLRHLFALRNRRPECREYIRAWIDEARRLTLLQSKGVEQ